MTATTMKDAALLFEGQTSRGRPLRVDIMNEVTGAVPWRYHKRKPLLLMRFRVRVEGDRPARAGRRAGNTWVNGMAIASKPSWRVECWCPFEAFAEMWGIGLEDNDSVRREDLMAIRVRLDMWLEAGRAA